MSDSRIPEPVREILDAEIDEADVPRIWRGVQARRARARAPRRWIGPALAAAAVLALGLGGWWSMHPSETPTELPVALTLASGGTIGDTLGEDARFTFEDGSWIRTEPHAGLALLENSGHSLVVHLRQGRIDVHVEPGGPRRWVVEAGEAAVEVVGTRFAVERQGPEVRVRVMRGAVLVRHPQLADGLRRLTAGQSVIVGTEVASSARVLDMPPEPGELEPSIAPSEVRPEAPLADREAPSSAAPAEPTLRPAGAWRDHASRREYERAYAALGPRGTSSWVRGSSPRELMLLADVARMSGHPAGALPPLEHILAHHAGDENIPVAAFTLGKVELDSLNRPAAAARHFERALTAGISGALADDARARLAQARARAGDTSGARDAACDYLGASPDGPRAAAMRRLCPRP